MVGKSPDINICGFFKTYLYLQSNVRSNILITHWEAGFIY